MANLYVDHPVEDLSIKNVIMAGMVKGADLQEKVDELIEKKRQPDINREICLLTTQYGNRVFNILSETVARCNSTLFVGGGDRGIYPAGKAITEHRSPVKLVCCNNVTLNII